MIFIKQQKYWEGPLFLYQIHSTSTSCELLYVREKMFIVFERFRKKQYRMMRILLKKKNDRIQEFKN